MDNQSAKGLLLAEISIQESYEKSLELLAKVEELSKGMTGYGHPKPEPEGSHDLLDQCSKITRDLTKIISDQRRAQLCFTGYASDLKTIALSAVTSKCKGDDLWKVSAWKKVTDGAPVKKKK